MFYKLWFCILLLLMPLLVLGQYENLVIDAFSPGKRVQIIYDPTGTLLDSSQNIYAIAKMYEKTGKQFVMTAKDIALYGNNDQWKGSLTIPDSCVSFFIVIKNELGTIDSNDGKGYMFVLKDSEGRPLPGGNASLATLFLQTYSPYGIRYDQQRGGTLVEQEFDNDPALKTNFIDTYIKTVDFTDAERKKKLAKEAYFIYKHYKEYNAEVLFALVDVYKKLGAKDKADKCYGLISEAFPKSRLAFQHRTMPYQEAFFKAATLNERLKIHHEMIQVMEEHMNPNRNLLNTTLDNELKASSSQTELPSLVLANELYSLTIQGLQLRKLLSENYWEKDNVSDWFKLVDSSKYYYHQVFLYNAFAEECLRQDTLLEKALEISTKAVNMAHQHLTAPRTMREQSFNNFSDSEIDIERRTMLAKYLATQASVLQRQNKTKEALKAHREAVKINDRSDAQVNEQFATFLIETKMYQEAREEIEQSMRIGKQTLAMEQMLEDLPKDTTKHYVDAKRLQQNYLKSKTASIAANMLNTLAPNFKLVSFEGDTVQLSDLKGKVVVLDFWASWCMPCLMSFPGMQKAVEKYQADSNVVFLFVNLDAGAVREKIKKYIYEKGYDFKVLLSEDDGTARSYSVHGIPVKFVIDKEGIIRFRKGSFENNIKDEVEELSIMIDLAMKESS